MEIINECRVRLEGLNSDDPRLKKAIELLKQLEEERRMFFGKPMVYDLLKEDSRGVIISPASLGNKKVYITLRPHIKKANSADELQNLLAEAIRWEHSFPVTKEILAFVKQKAESVREALLTANGVSELVGRLSGFDYVGQNDQLMDVTRAKIVSLPFGGQTINRGNYSFLRFFLVDEEGKVVKTNLPQAVRLLPWE